MKKVLLVCTVLAATSLMALKAQNRGRGQSGYQAPRYKITGTTLLNDQVTNGGYISKADFDKLMLQPFWVKDSTSGKVYPVAGFSFTYAERGLYEDTTGKPLVITDYAGTESTSQLLPEYYTRELLNRSKSGDTAVISNVVYKFQGLDKNNKKFEDLGYGTPVKLIIK